MSISERRSKSVVLTNWLSMIATVSIVLLIGSSGCADRYGSERETCGICPNLPIVPSAIDDGRYHRIIHNTQFGCRLVPSLPSLPYTHSPFFTFKLLTKVLAIHKM